ncbi:MAG: UDP-N-acetyl-D-glucosamine dehydrogenase, partial [Gammaproteobacteria bacterium]|nr:UDP-N-acetyl-D-glucosamine dehydrogenase [Gammaproteobacteria bacterium]
MQKLISKFNNKQATIAIIGLGYVGLPLLLRYLSLGYKVIGIDIDPKKVEALNRSESYIKHIDCSAIKQADKSQFEVTTDFAKV